MKAICQTAFRESMNQRIRQYQLGIYMKFLESERGSAYGFQGNDDLIVRIPENEAEGELWSYEM